MSDPTNPGVPAPPGVPLPSGIPSAYPPAPPGAPAAPADPTTSWQAPPPGGGFPPAGPPPGAEAPGGSGKGGKGKFLALGLVAIAVLGGGGFAAAQLLSNSAGGGGGASSPEAAAQELIAALTASDVIGVIELLPEGERELLLDVTGDLTEAGDRLGLTDETFTLEGFQGITFELSGAEFEVADPIEGDDTSLTMVSLTAGEGSLEVDGGALTGNLGPVVQALADELGEDIEEPDDFDESFDVEDVLDDLRDEADDEGLEFFNPLSIAVIEEDGRFFPSLGFTVAELARLAANADGADLDEPDLDGGIDLAGAESPEAAVQALIDASTELDAEAALAVLDPGEAGAAQVYLPLLGDLPEGDDTGFSIVIDETEVESLGGGVNRVVPIEFTISGDIDEGSFEFSIGNGCFSLDTSGFDEEISLDETCPAEEFEGSIAEDIDVPREITDLIDAVLPIEGGVVTVERDGEHFVSPTRTVAQTSLGLVAGLESADVAEGGIVFEALSGGLEDEFTDLGEDLEAAFEDADADEIAIGILALLDSQGITVNQILEASSLAIFGGVVGVLGESAEVRFEEVGESIGDDDTTTDTTFEDDFDDDFGDVRLPTGASGSDGELLPFDVVEGQSFPGEIQTFIVVGDGSTAFIGAQTLGDDDLVVTIFDVATGEELARNDDRAGAGCCDPEVEIFLEEGQQVFVDVSDLGDNGSAPYVVYYET